jgi:hypothetical protein
MNKKPRYFLIYLLGIYVFLQFIWWGFHLIDLTKSQSNDTDLVQKRVIMIIGEGFVFLKRLAHVKIAKKLYAGSYT